MRNISRTHSYYVEELGGVVLEAYNIIGDATTPNLLAILTGYVQHELPEARCGYPGAQQVDDFSWI